MLKEKEKNTEVDSLQQNEKANLFLLPISLLSLPPPLWKKSCRVFLAFSFSAARWKSWPYPALLARTSFFIFSVSFPPVPLPPFHHRAASISSAHLPAYLTASLPLWPPRGAATARTTLPRQRCAAAVKTEPHGHARSGRTLRGAAERFHAMNSQPTHFQSIIISPNSFQKPSERPLLTISSEFLEAVDLLLGSSQLVLQGAQPSCCQGPRFCLALWYPEARRNRTPWLNKEAGVFKREERAKMI